MLELYKKYRIKFLNKGDQRKFILDSKKNLGFTNVTLAKKLDISQRTITDWVSEKFNMSYYCARKLAKLSKKSIPKEHEIISWKNHMRTIAKIGGKNRVAMYGRVANNEKFRLKKWQDWWQKTGKHKSNNLGRISIMDIKYPSRNKKLAEFVGIMLGDGGVAPYHIHITLSSEEKKYTKYILNLIYDLFGVRPKLHKLKYANAVDIVVQRKKLVNFCQEIGLVLGNKVRQQVDIPDWIKNNDELSKRCLKGLVDTDGCFYFNSYKSNNKKYSYFKMAFKNASQPLINSVANLLIKSDINARIGKHKKDVRIENEENVKKYVEEIGSSNYKHLEKIKKWRRVRVVEYASLLKM